MEFIYNYIPLWVVVLVEIAKRIKQVPVSRDNAHWAVLILVAILVCASAYNKGELTQANAADLTANIITFSVYAYGGYAFVKGLVIKTFVSLFKK